MQNYQGHYLCDGCGQTFTNTQWDNRCTPHDDDCPNADSDGEYMDGCGCDLNYHEHCCPECAEDGP